MVTEFFKISRLPGIPQTLLLNREAEMIGMFRGGGPRVIEQMVKRVEQEMGYEGKSMYPLDKEAASAEDAPAPDADAKSAPSTEEKAEEAVKKLNEAKK